MSLSFIGLGSNFTFNSGSTDTSFATGTSVTQFIAGDLYICEVSGDSVPTSLVSSDDITWSLIVSESSAIGGHAVWVGIATASNFDVTTTVTFASASKGCFGGMTRVSGITDDGANGTLLVTRSMTEYVSGLTHSFDFSAGSDPSYGYWLGAMMHNTTAAETFTANSAGWTSTSQAFRAGIPTFTPPFYNWQSYGKLNPSQPIGGSWDHTGASEQSFAVALEIRPSVETTAFWGIAVYPVT